MKELSVEFVCHGKQVIKRVFPDSVVGLIDEDGYRPLAIGDIIMPDRLTREQKHWNNVQVPLAVGDKYYG